MKKRDRNQCRLYAPSTPILEDFMLKNIVSSTSDCKPRDIIPKVKETKNDSSEDMVKKDE